MNLFSFPDHRINLQTVTEAQLFVDKLSWGKRQLEVVVTGGNFMNWLGL